MLNHKHQQCGVYQYGKRLHHILQTYQEIGYEYQEVETEQEYYQLMDNHHYNAVIYNYCPPTMPWLNEQTIRHTQENIGILHECDPAYFDKKIRIDPTAPETTHSFKHVWKIPRLIVKSSFLFTAMRICGKRFYISCLPLEINKNKFNLFLSKKKIFYCLFTYYR